MKQQVKLEIFKYNWNDNEDEFSIREVHKLRDPDGSVVIHDTIDIEIEFSTLNEQQVIKLRVNGFKTHKENILNKAQKEAENIDMQIQQLMALPTEVVSDE